MIQTAPEFTDGLDDGAHDDETDEPKPAPKKAKRKSIVETLFEPNSEEKRAEGQRMHDRRIGLLIGPKNLEKLRAFGYDVVHVQEAPLTPGVAHRGLTE